MDREFVLQLLYDNLESAGNLAGASHLDDVLNMICRFQNEVEAELSVTSDAIAAAGVFAARRVA